MPCRGIAGWYAKVNGCSGTRLGNRTGKRFDAREVFPSVKFVGNRFSQLRSERDDHAIDVLVAFVTYEPTKASPVYPSCNSLVSACTCRSRRCSTCPDHESAGHHQGPNALCRSLCAPRHAVAVEFSPDHQRISAEDDAGELRLHQQISALCV